VSTNPEHSRRAAQVSALLRRAQAAEAARQLPEAVTLLREVVRIDPRNWHTLHRLAELFRTRLDRPREAAAWYAHAAQCQERDGLHARAIAAWRLVLRCDPARLEAHERIGVLYEEAGRLADARLHYERSAQSLEEAGYLREASVLKAHRAALPPAPSSPIHGTAHSAGLPGATRPTSPAADASPAGETPVSDVQASGPDAEALGLAAERLETGRVYHHYGLNQQARQHLEELLVSLPRHAEARQLLVEVCRALGDTAAAAEHLRIMTDVLQGKGPAESPGEAAPQPPGLDPPSVDLPPIEEWVGDEDDAPPQEAMVDLLEEVRGDLECLADRLDGKPRSH